MTTTCSSRGLQGRLSEASLGKVIALLECDSSLPKRRRDDLTSALRTVGKALRMPVERVPAHPAYLNGKLSDFAPASVGITAARWTNVKSLTRAALKHVGIANMPGRYRVPLTPAWARLFKQLEARHHRPGLSRFVHYCTVNGVEPDAVDDAILAEFLRAMETEALVDKPRKIHRMTCRLWNKAVAEVLGWPQKVVRVPSYTTHYALPWTAFPTSLKLDVEQYLDRQAGADLLLEIDFRPLRQSSIETRRYQLHAFVSAMVHGGATPTSLASLADLVVVDRVKLGLQFLLSRNGNKPSAQTGHCMSLITAIARYVVKVDADHLERLQRLSRRVSPPQAGMTSKNRDRLRPFDSEANRNAIFCLPQVLMDKARRSKKTPTQVALIVQTAVAIEILLMLPLRLKNLSSLLIDNHLQAARDGRLHIVVPAHEVKNGQPIDVILPAESSRLIASYIEFHRPLLCDRDCKALFPGRAGAAKSGQWIRQKMVETIYKQTGLKMNPHLFRHFAAKHYLDAHPGAYGVVKLALESVQDHILCWQSLLSISRTDAQRRNAEAFRLRHSQSLLRRRQRFSQAMVRSTIQRLGSTTNLPVSQRRTISTFTSRQARAKPV